MRECAPTIRKCFFFAPTCWSRVVDAAGQAFVAAAKRLHIIEPKTFSRSNGWSGCRLPSAPKLSRESYNKNRASASSYVVHWFNTTQIGLKFVRPISMFFFLFPFSLSGIQNSTRQPTESTNTRAISRGSSGYASQDSNGSASELEHHPHQGSQKSELPALQKLIHLVGALPDLNHPILAQRKTKKVKRLAKMTSYVVNGMAATANRSYPVAHATGHAAYHQHQNYLAAAAAAVFPQGEFFFSLFSSSRAPAASRGSPSHGLFPR